MSSNVDEQLIELITTLRTMATTTPDTIRGILATEKVAQETIRMMASLGIIDKDALSNALQKLVPEQPAANRPVSGPTPVPNLPMQGLFGNPPPAPYQIPTQGYDTRSFDAPDAGWNAMQNPVVNRPPPPTQTGPLPGLVHNLNLSAEERDTVMRALAMSQAELDMLPPQQRAIFMQLRQMMPGR